MKYIDLVQTQCHVSSIFSWKLIQLDNDEYKKIMDFVSKNKDVEVPEDLIKKIEGLSYP